MVKNTSLQLRNIMIIGLLAATCTVQTGGFRPWMRAAQSMTFAKQTMARGWKQLKNAVAVTKLPLKSSALVGSGLGMYLFTTLLSKKAECMSSEDYQAILVAKNLEERFNKIVGYNSTYSTVEQADKLIHDIRLFMKVHDSEYSYCLSEGQSNLVHAMGYAAATEALWLMNNETLLQQIVCGNKEERMMRANQLKVMQTVLNVILDKLYHHDGECYQWELIVNRLVNLGKKADALDPQGKFGGNNSCIHNFVTQWLSKNYHSHPIFVNHPGNKKIAENMFSDYAVLLDGENSRTSKVRQHHDAYVERCPKQGKSASTHFSCLLQMLPYLNGLKHGNQQEKQEGEKLKEKIAKQYPRNDATILYGLHDPEHVDDYCTESMHKNSAFTQQLDLAYEKKRALEEQGYTVFVHAQQSAYFFAHWLKTRLTEMIQEKSFNDEFSFIHPEQCIESQKKLSTVLGDPQSCDTRSDVVFMNYILSGNTRYVAGGDSSLAYALYNSNRNTSDTSKGIIKNVKIAGISDAILQKYSEQLSALHAEYQHITSCGALYLIAIKDSDVSQSVTFVGPRDQRKEQFRVIDKYTKAKSLIDDTSDIVKILRLQHERLMPLYGSVLEKSVQDPIFVMHLDELLSPKNKIIKSITQHDANPTPEWENLKKRSLAVLEKMYADVKAEKTKKEHNS